MRKFILFVAIAASGLVACNKSDVALENTASRQKAPKTTDVVLDSISQIICEISDNTAAMQQVLSAVNQNLLFGMDEYVYVRDILFPEESKIIDRNVDISTLTELLRTAFKVDTKLSLKENLANPLVSYVVENEIQIYFPYSARWDKTTKPFVVPVEDEQNDKDVFAYTKDKNGLKKFVIAHVTEKYLRENPVLAVMAGEVPYEKLPKFNEGIYEKDGIIWMVRIPKEKMIFDFSNDDEKHGYDDPNYVYRIYIGNYSFHELDEGIIWRRPEVRTKVILATLNGNDTTYESHADYQREFTRDEVDNGTEIPDRVAIQDWDPSPNKTVMTVTVWEVDGGNDTAIPIDMSIPNKFTLKTSITIGNKNDFQGVLPAMERDVYFITAKTAVGNAGLTPDGFAYYWCGNAKFSIKYMLIPRN
ncbi:MAG: hypothetical protein LBS50_04815 [Prevotellaceae bacterium]|jgi:hypothetical protein|nr:hypothetical protein [Prevotellaceae bacterium]